MLETIMERYQNEELYTFNLKVTPSEELQLHEMPQRKEKLKEMAGKMVEESKDELREMLKKVISERFDGCQF